MRTVPKVRKYTFGSWPYFPMLRAAFEKFPEIHGKLFVNMINKHKIDVLYIHPNGNQTDYNIPMGVIGLMNSIDCAKAGKMYFEVTNDVISNAQIIVMDCHWYFSLSEIGRLAKKFKKINPKVVIIVGGYTATIFAETIVDRFKIDYVIKGDAEAPFPLLIKALLEGKSARNIPNIVNRGFITPQSYKLTKEDYSGSDYITIDWFPTFKRRMKTIHNNFPFCWREPLGLYPFIPIFKGCSYDCKFCYASKTLNFALCKRGIVSRSPESIINDLLICSKRKDVKQVYMAADFIDILGVKFANKIFSQKYDINLSYCFNISNSLSMEMLKKMLSSFNKCHLWFIFSEIFHRNSLKKRYDYLAEIFEYLRRYENKIKLSLFITKDNKTFEKSYAKLKKIYKKVIFSDHRPWFIDIPYPNKSYDLDMKGYFNTWIKKSRKSTPRHFVAKSNKDNTCKFYLELAIGCVIQENFNKATHYYKQALNLKPNNSAIYLGLARAYFGLKHYEEAIKTAKKVIELLPKETDAYLLLGSCYEQTKRNDNALEIYKKALKIFPNEGAIYLGLAKTYFTLKNYEETIETANKAIELNYKEGNVHFLLGFCYEKTKQYKKAIEELKKAEKINPEEAHINSSLSNCYRNIGQIEHSNKELDKGILNLKRSQQTATLNKK